MNDVEIQTSDGPIDNYTQIGKKFDFRADFDKLTTLLKNATTNVPGNENSDILRELIIAICKF